MPATTPQIRPHFTTPARHSCRSLRAGDTPHSQKAYPLSPPVAPQQPRRAHCQGITLVELLAVLAIVAILGAMAVPAYQDSVARGHVRNAAEAIHGLFLQAKAEAPIRDRRLSVVVDQHHWCVGLSDNPDCDCTLTSGANACYLDIAGHQVLHRVDGGEFPQVSVTENFPGVRTNFYHIRRNASPGGTVTIASRGQILQIKVGLNGRVRLCTPASSPIVGYRIC